MIPALYPLLHLVQAGAGSEPGDHRVHGMGGFGEIAYVLLEELRLGLGQVLQLVQIGRHAFPVVPYGVVVLFELDLLGVGEAHVRRRVAA